MTQNELIVRFRSGLYGLWLMVIITTAAGCSDAARSHSEATSSSWECDRRTNVADIVTKIQEPYHIEVTGHNYRWHVRYPNSTGRIETEKDALAVRDIHVPLETEVVLVLKSTDYVYVLSLPEFGKKEIAVPTLEFRMQFRPETTGQFALLGEELCGDPHPELKGSLVVEPQAQFLDWLQKLSSRAPSETPYLTSDSP